MFLYIPFICITLGAVINWKGLPDKALKVSDILMNVALFALMAVIGLNIGLSDTVMKNLGSIGVKCLLISFAAIWCSVGLTVLCEKTVMPLEKIRLQLLAEKNSEDVLEEAASEEKRRASYPAYYHAGIYSGGHFGRVLPGAEGRECLA